MAEAAGTAVAAAGGAPAVFAHLHLHTEYSLLDGANRIDKLMDRVKALGMTSVACTDHGNLFGAVAFYQAAKDRGLKPILGVEAYVAQGDRKDRTHTGVADGGYHLVLLAQTDEGWSNLLVLASEAYLTGFYYKPRVDRALLEKHSAGLIAINGHLGSEIGEHLLEFERTGERAYYEKALESARWHARTFGPDAQGKPRFYLEMQHHIPEQNSINKHIIAMSRELSLPIVCDNDAHFLRAEDHDAHDTLVCISTGKSKIDTERMRYPADLYVKSPQEMEALFVPYGDAGREALDNAAAIAERCNVTLPLGRNNAPAVRVRVPGTGSLPKHDDAKYGGDLTAWYADYCARFEVLPFKEQPTAEDLASAKKECDTALRMLAEAGVVWRYGSGGEGSREGKAIRERLERELTILADKNISAYFLIVWDFVNWGRQNGVPALARGSGVGTMAGYVLGLSNACPVRYGLLFERFTDPDRSEYPDIDIDLCQDGRGRVIDYVRRKYGHVAQIITFGTLKARAAIRDTGRVMEMPLGEVDRIAKLVPEQLGITLDAALEQEPDLRKLYQTEATVRRIVDNARAFEGQARHASVHAAGVIVATRPLSEIVPLYKSPGGEDVVTQWDGPTCEKMGLLKMDFLGLRTISVVERCKRLIREGLGEAGMFAAVGRSPGDGGPHPLDLDRLSFADQRVFDIFRRGDTTGVFQFESPGMRRMLVEMKPDRLEDLIAANALFRPGPMDLIPDYVRRKHGQDVVPRVHAIVDRFTAETYGVMVYQEQVMQIVHGLGGIKLRDAYSLIKNISKKKHDKIEKERPKFVEGACRQGLSRPQAEELFELILKFAGYGFNKSHSTGYAIVAYQTAYLKTYFPAQYMAAFLTFESAAMQTAEWVPYLEDCKKTRVIDPASGAVVRTGVEVKPPDVNQSDADFAVVFAEREPRAASNGHVRFGLKAIKGVGEKSIDTIIAARSERGVARPYASLFDFCERVPIGGSGGNGGSVNKTTLEALIKSGAMDCLHGRTNRAAMLATLDAAVSAGVKAQSDKASGQGGLFGGGDHAPNTPQSASAAALARATAWTESQTLASEKEALGFYVSSHPLDQHAALVAGLGNATTRTVRERLVGADNRITLGGLITAVRTLMVKSGKSAGQKMAVLAVEDKEGQVDCVAFSDVYARYSDAARADALVFITGKVDHARGEPQIIIESVVPIESAASALARKVRLTVDCQRLNGGAGDALERVLGVIKTPVTGSRAPRPAGAGATPSLAVELVVMTDEHEVLLDAPNLRLNPTEESLASLREVLGPENVSMLGGAVEAVKREPKPWERRAPVGGGVEV